jgi:hypothetical protein
VELDCPGAEEHRAANLGISPPLRYQQGDLQFLRGELLAVLSGAGHGFAAGAQLGAGVATAPRPAQPFAVRKMRARVLEDNAALLVQPQRVEEEVVNLTSVGISHSLRFYWATNGNPAWNPETIAGAGSVG